MNPLVKVAAVAAVAIGAFLIRQYRIMLGLSEEVTEELKYNRYTTYTGKYFKQDDLYDNRIFQETRCHYYDKFYKSGNVSPGMLKAMFKWKYNQQITNKDMGDIFTDIGNNTGRFVEECAISYAMSRNYLLRNKSRLEDIIR